MNFSDNFYKNPDLESMIKYENDIDWNRLSYSIERALTLNEFKLFYKKIAIPIYIHSHYISSDIFTFLDENDLITFGDRYTIISRQNMIDDSNIKTFCGEYASLWAVAFDKNDISEDILIENFNTITSGRKTTVDLIKNSILEREEEDKYSRFLLLVELNES